MRKGEILNFKWNQVVFYELEKKGKITLENDQTKNKHPRTAYFTGDLYQALLEAKRARDAKFPHSPWVCTYRKGERLKSFPKSWNTAVKKAGLKGRIPHDFRRSAVRDMVDSGIPEKVAMEISGHRTRSVFDTYHIVNEDAIKRASEQRGAYEKVKIGPMGIESGICPEMRSSEERNDSSK